MSKYPYRTKLAAKVEPRQVAIYLARVGQILRDLRLERAISQVELASKCGVHPSRLNRIERGSAVRPRCVSARGPHIETMIRIALALGVTPRELFP